MASNNSDSYVFDKVKVMPEHHMKGIPSECPHQITPDAGRSVTIRVALLDLQMGALYPVLSKKSELLTAHCSGCTDELRAASAHSSQTELLKLCLLTV